MVGYLYPAQERRLWVKAEPVTLRGLSLLGAALPEGKLPRQLERGAKVLKRRGCTRVLVDSALDCSELPEILGARGLASVDELPLCRAKAPQLALALVEALPLRRRCVALRGKSAGDAWPTAATLCPYVGTLLLDFQWGEEALARRLRANYGAAALHLGQGPAPQASVEFSPCGEAEGKPLRLWGEPELAGLKLTAGGEESLPLLELLWETGRLGLENVEVQWGE